MLLAKKLIVKKKQDKVTYELNYVDAPVAASAYQGRNVDFNPVPNGFAITVDFPPIEVRNIECFKEEFYALNGDAISAYAKIIKELSAVNARTREKKF